MKKWIFRVVEWAGIYAGLRLIWNDWHHRINADFNQGAIILLLGMVILLYCEKDERR